MTQHLRRIGHMIERSPGNIASAVGSDGGARAFLAEAVPTPGADSGAGGSATGSADGWGGQGLAVLGSAGSPSDGTVGNANG